jgi:hypothetical protein
MWASETENEKFLALMVTVAGGTGSVPMSATAGTSVPSLVALSSTEAYAKTG